MKFTTPIKFRELRLRSLNISYALLAVAVVLWFRPGLMMPAGKSFSNAVPSFIGFLKSITQHSTAHRNTRQTSECVHLWLFALKIKFVLEAVAVIIIDLNKQTPMRWKWTKFNANEAISLTIYDAHFTFIFVNLIATDRSCLLLCVCVCVCASRLARTKRSLELSIWTLPNWFYAGAQTKATNHFESLIKFASTH